ncbi:MAG: cytochrome C [Deltaproteobacteria bacterium]|nr:cytochrome C [Deltaproteobacteria bacterium]
MSKLFLTLIVALYLATIEPAAFGAQPAVQLPEGDGKPHVQGLCATCHELNLIPRSSGYTRAGWQELIGNMINIAGTPAEDAITQYLAKHFPPNTNLQPTLVPGPISISFKEWKVPQLGQRARDPVQTADGSIWYCGQFGNLVGRINPKTGEVSEYALPDKALPHSITPDRDGNIWYTGNGNGTVGKLDVKTGKITEYKMPDPNAKDPHTAVFDEKGRLFFTLQVSNMIGRLVPSTGEIKLATVARKNSRPYGIKLAADGSLWVSCNGSNCLLKIDPETLAIREFDLPEGTTVRRLDLAKDGTIWYVNSGLGRLGRMDPKTGQYKEWMSPSGAKSHPYAIAVVDGMVWFNESGMRPDPLVRFDPTTEKFQSWPIPSGNIYGGILRHMRPTKDGNLLIHQTSTNRIYEVEVKSGARRVAN